jgi:hypothetical protein
MWYLLHFQSVYYLYVCCDFVLHSVTRPDHILIFVNTRARNLSLSWAMSIQSMPPSHFLKVYFNIIIPSTPGSSKCSPSLRSPYQDPVCTSPYVLHARPISFFSIWSYTFVSSEVWDKLQHTFFSSSTLSSIYYRSIRFVLLTGAFQRIQFVCVDAMSLCEWFPTFRTWVVRSLETLGTTHQTTQRIFPANLNPSSIVC